MIDIVVLIFLGTVISILINTPLMDELIEDYNDIEHGIPDNHKRDVWFRGLLLTIVSLLAAHFRQIFWGIESGYVLNFIACFGFGVGCYILIFDYALNKLRGLSWNYLGKESDIDQLLKKYDPYHVLIVKCCSFLAGLLLYIFL